MNEYVYPCRHCSAYPVLKKDGDKSKPFRMAYTHIATYHYETAEIVIEIWNRIFSDHNGEKKGIYAYELDEHIAKINAILGKADG